MKNPREMSPGELKTWLSAHLQGVDSPAADIEIRRDEAPYEQPALFWKSGTESFRHSLRQAIIDLLDESAAKPWTPRAFNELMRVVEVAKLDEAEDSIEQIVRRRSFLTGTTGMQLHMQALRTLLALGWNGTLNFWLLQEKLLDGRWPALIFKGLSKHGLDVAFAHLATIVVSKTVMQDVLNLFPRIMETEPGGISKLWDGVNSIAPSLPAEAVALAKEWFRLQNYPPPKSFTDPRLDNLLVGIRGIVGDVNPKPTVAALAGRMNYRHYAYVA